MTEGMPEPTFSQLERDLTRLLSASAPEEFAEKLGKQLQARAEELRTARQRQMPWWRRLLPEHRPALAFALVVMVLLVIAFSALGPQRVLAGFQRIVESVSEIRLKDLIPPGLIESGPTPTPTATATPFLSPTPGSALPQLTPGQPVTITTIDMIDAANGWAFGGNQDPGDRLLRTRDGGLTWQDVTPPYRSADENAPGKMKNAYFLDTNSAWVAVYYLPQSYLPEEFPLDGIIWRTRDGGLTWEPGEPVELYLTLFGPDPGSKEIHDPSPPPLMQFLDAKRGWILIRDIGSGMHKAMVSLYMTKDGGEHWEKVFDLFSDRYLDSGWKTGMTFAGDQTGWSTTSDYPLEVAFLRHTSGEGRTWEQTYLPPPGFDPGLVSRAYCADTHSPHLFSPTVGMLVVDCVTFDESVQPPDILYATENGGRSWHTRPTRRSGVTR